MISPAADTLLNSQVADINSIINKLTQIDEKITRSSRMINSHNYLLHISDKIKCIDKNINNVRYCKIESSIINNFTCDIKENLEKVIQNTDKELEEVIDWMLDPEVHANDSFLIETLSCTLAALNKRLELIQTIENRAAICFTNANQILLLSTQNRESIKKNFKLSKNMF